MKMGKIRSSDPKRRANRRRQRRIRIKEGVFAMASQPPVMGEITDVSSSGLAFHYPSDQKLPSGPYELDILAMDDGLRISRLPIKTAWDRRVSKGKRKQGIQFRNLTPRQRSLLLALVENARLEGR